MKRILAIFLSVMLMVSILGTLPAMADTDVITGKFGDGFTYTYEPNTGYLIVEGNGRIPAVANGKYPWASFVGQVTGLILGEGVTGIPGEAFRGATQLTDVIFPTTLTSVNNSAFRGCNNIQAVWITEGNETLPELLSQKGPAEFKSAELLGVAGDEISGAIDTIINYVPATVADEEPAGNETNARADREPEAGTSARQSSGSENSSSAPAASANTLSGTAKSAAPAGTVTENTKAAAPASGTSEVSAPAGTTNQSSGSGSTKTGNGSSKTVISTSSGRTYGQNTSKGAFRKHSKIKCNF
ncbi:MAG: leucine-rich repeat protein [Clostridia bacterium]|nr:leucine-rich repeat protein [Clostridia bacterium]